MRFEYVRLFWRHGFEDEPVVILYEVDTLSDREARRAVDVYRDGSVRRMDDLYAGALEVSAIPEVEAMCRDFGEEFTAELMDGEEFERIFAEKKV